MKQEKTENLKYHTVHTKNKQLMIFHADSKKVENSKKKHFLQ